MESARGDPNPAQLQSYGTSETHVGIPGGSFRVLYAPSEGLDEQNEVFDGQGNCGAQQVRVRANPAIDGALVIDSMWSPTPSIVFNSDYGSLSELNPVIDRTVGPKIGQ